MSTDNVQLSGPVTIRSDAVARVAFDLMEKIAMKTSDEKQRGDKTYWLKLYAQCYKSASGHYDIESILAEDKMK